MARKKDFNWDLPGHNSWESIKVAVLMDIRDELKKLNNLVGCPNAVAIPHILRGIRRKLPTPKPRKKRVDKKK